MRTRTLKYGPQTVATKGRFRDPPMPPVLLVVVLVGPGCGGGKQKKP